MFDDQTTIWGTVIKMVEQIFLQRVDGLDIRKHKKKLSTRFDVID